MLPDDAAHVAPIAAGLAAEARSVSAEGDGELSLIYGLIAEQVRNRHLSGRDEPVVTVLIVFRIPRVIVVAVEEVFSELGELAGAEERLGVDHVGGEDLGISVLAGVEVEHEVGEGALEAGSSPVVDDEP